MGALESHPDEKTLADFGQGRLGDAASVAIEEHLESCGDCAQILDRLHASDRWVNRSGPISTDVPPPSARGIKDLLAHMRSHSPHSSEPDVGCIGDFQILREIGRGGMGIVYEARQMSLDRIVALKVLPLHALSKPATVLRFRREAQAAARLHHTHIVPVLEVGHADDTLYYAMQFIDGCGLDTVVEAVRCRRSESAETKKASVPISADPSAYFQQVASIGMQAAEALHYAHMHRVLHRDIKPSNLLLDTSGTLWITDFGLAKVDEDSVTRTGELLGTLRYMAPEQLRGEASARSDVYSLGVTLYEMLTLRPAFTGDDKATLVEQIGRQDPPRLCALDSRIPRDLETIVTKAIAKEPGRRYASALELADDLRAFCDGRPIRARPAGVAERLLLWSRRNPALATFGAITVAALATVAIVATVAYLQTTTALEVARASQERAEHNAYSMMIALADRSLEAGEATQALQMLEQCGPDSGSSMRPGWEWRYLRQQCDSSEVIFRDHGYSGCVYRVAYSPDGKWLASVGGGNPNYRMKIGNEPIVAGETIVRRADSGAIVHTLRGHGNVIMALGFSGDGRRLITGSVDETAKVWDLDTGAEIATYRKSEGRVLWALLSRDGRRAVTANLCDHLPVGQAFQPDGQVGKSDRQAGKPDLLLAWRVHVWDADTAKPLFSFDGHSPVLTPDGRRLISVAGLGGRVEIRDLETGAVLGGFEHAATTYSRLAIHPDSSRLIALERNPVQFGDKVTMGGHAVRLCSLAGERSHQLRASAVFRCVGFSRDGRQCATGGLDGSVRLWDVDSGDPIKVFHGHRVDVHDLAFSPDGRRLATASIDGSLRLWNLAQSPRGRAVATSFPNLLLPEFAFSEDGKALQIVGLGRKQLSEPTVVQTWEIATGHAKRTHIAALTNDQKPFSRGDFAFSGDGKRLAGPGAVPGTLAVVDAATGETIHLFDGLAGLASVALSRDGRRVAIDTFDAAAGQGDLSVWDVDSGKRLVRWPGTRTPANCLAFSPDGSRLAAAGGDSARVWVWNADTGQVLGVSAAPSGIRRLTFSPDGQLLVAADAVGERLYVMNALGTEVRRTLTAPRKVGGLAFSPDGHRLAAVGIEGHVQLWDTESGQEVYLLRSLAASPSNIDFNPRVLFSPDGRRIAASSWNGAISIWEGGSGGPD